MTVKINGGGMIGKLSRDYVLYMDKPTSELLRSYVGRDATVYFTDGSLWFIVNGTLTVKKAFKPPRVMVFRPRGLAPTWQKLHGRMFAVTVEVKDVVENEAKATEVVNGGGAP